MIFTVNASKKYDVIVENGILKNVGELCRGVLPGCGKTLVVSDSQVAPLYLKTVITSLKKSGFDVYSTTFEAGEESKNLTTFSLVCETAASLGLCRDDAFIALGGGVVGDLTGFVAACYMRGVRFVQIPTTLLAAIDSSVGGKTAVDLVQGKNLVGAFHQPVGVFFDPSVLKTLPENEWKNGLGEGIKYAILCGGKTFDLLQSGLNKTDLSEFCYLCAKYKAEIVEKDEKDLGLRQLLNLGHTVGHATEKLSSYKIPHGKAVAFGIKTMALASKNAGILSACEYEKITDLLEKYGLLFDLPYTSEQIAEASHGDKKNRSDGLNAVVINGIGDCSIEKTTLEKFGEYIKCR